MPVHKILVYPHPTLLKPSVKFDIKDETKFHLVESLIETYWSVRCLGLAMPQIGYNYRVIIINAPKLNMGGIEPILMINPEIISSSKEMYDYEEGCLSLPGAYFKYQRPKTVTVRYTDRNGQDIELEVSDTAATCIQHEIDHLNGKLVIQKVSTLHQSRARKEIEKQMRRAKANTIKCPLTGMTEEQSDNITQMMLDAIEKRQSEK